uniref:non-specific serine/threonine protein kinase n=1 Tax=Kalanchoe fedtschenkoi TaxID=63787 RepID=A0A7N0TZQ8_KALFE
MEGMQENARQREQESPGTLPAPSHVLWATGTLSEPIPNGFYSVVPEKRLKELFSCVPTLDELSALEDEDVKPDIILVDTNKDKKLLMLKELAVALVRGLKSNPSAIIRKIARLVSDFYKQPSAEPSPRKAELEESFVIADKGGVKMLGQIKYGSSRPRAILFKLLADTVGLESRLVVGNLSDIGAECADSYKHLSVIVVLNSVDVFVDLMRSPGQLIPRSSKALFMSHIYGTGESDSTENDSCDSPMEPNSPLYGIPDRNGLDSVEKDEGLLQRKLEAFSNISGPSLRSAVLRSATKIERSLSLSHSDPNIETAAWRRSRRKAFAEQRTASSSPEHPSFQVPARSILSGDRKLNRYLASDATPSRSDGASTSDARRLRRRSVSITPEIGDDIARAVRAMNETLKQNRLLEGQQNDRSFLNGANSLLNNQRDGIGGASSQMSAVGDYKAISLPSSPHDLRVQTANRSGASNDELRKELVSRWNKVLESSKFNNQPLLPYHEWNIDFSELTVGTRVGIGFFGEVFRGMWNGTEVAIKVFLEQELTDENMEDFCNEISILSRLRHPNVILFLGACTKPPNLSMVTEYMEGGSIYHLIHLSGQGSKISWRRRLKMIRDICRGLMCMHRMKIVHRDLKSANCLVNKHWTVKLCDFGLSKIMTETSLRDSCSAGTPEWMAPELIRKEPFTEKCDIFSLGVIMWELCTLNKPWDGVHPEKVVHAVANEESRLEIPEGPIGRLISECWAEPNARPTCAEILARLPDCE